MKPRLIILLVLMTSVLILVWAVGAKASPLGFMIRGGLIGAAVILAWWMIEDMQEIADSSKPVSRETLRAIRERMK